MQRSVRIPEDKRTIVECTIDGKRAIVTINTSLREFDAKDVFAWTCSIFMCYKESTEDGMPTDEEFKVVNDYLEGVIKEIVGDVAHPNALFLAREYWDGTCTIYLQVYNPEPVDQLLQKIIQEKSYPREFEYEIVHDPEWEKVSWYTQEFK